MLFINDRILFILSFMDDKKLFVLSFIDDKSVSVFLYNYAVHLLYKKSWDGYNFYCMLKQAETDVQSTSNRKLPNFYEKVTDFLLESYRISKWWQNHVFTETCRICHIWRILTRWMMWLFMQANWLFMQKNGLTNKTFFEHFICRRDPLTNGK